MGDFLAPKRRDVVDRLRRRIEQYRHHHFNAENRYNLGRPGLYEQQKQDTELLHHRWLESKAKKAAKQSKVKDSGGGGGGGGANSQSDHRNLVTQKLKQKIDATANNDNAAAAAAAAASADSVFQFEDSDHQQQQQQSGGQGNPSGGGGSKVSSSTNVGVTGGGQDGVLPRLSVQIVQQISTQQKSPQTIHTNVTINSTLQPRYPPPPANNPHHPQGHPEGSPATQCAANSSNINIHTSTSSQPQAHGATSVSANTTTTTNLGASNNSSSGSAIPGGGNPAAAAHASTETSVHTSIECKQEPVEDVHCRGDSVNASGAVPVPDLPIDELQDILDSIEKDEDIPANLIKELDDFDKIYHKVQIRAESNGGAESSSVFSSLEGCGSPGLSKATAHFTDPTQVTSQPQHASHVGAPPTALTPTMFEAPQPMGGMTGSGTGLPVRPPPSIVAEPTGPAAETLKQMAAQHQHQASGAPSFPGKSLTESPFADPYDPFVRNRNGYPANYSSQNYPPQAGATGAAGYPSYGQNAGYGDGSLPMGQYPGSKQELTAMGYNQTKPLTHYPGEGHGGPGVPPGTHSGQPAAPSSLQQLQNQVASHFSPMHITQTQHVQLAQGPHRMQLSQTQQVQMAAAAAAAQQQQLQQQQGAAPPGMTVSQQQSFNMASHMQGQGQPPQGMGMTSAREMHIMQEKMRREQQYMNRPPPEYKPHPAARTAGPPYQPATTVNAHSGGGSSTPLQTMQNMVNQTPPYPTIKGEVGGGAGGGNGGVMTQMSAVQSMAASVNTTGPHMGASLAQATQSMAAAYQQPMPQRPPSYSPHTTTPTPNGVSTPSNGGGGNNGSASNVSSSHPHPASSSASSQAPSNYTSALMRNQRPPNVNVGPEGLNISQPRAHPGHPGHMGHSHPHGDGWPRPMIQGHPGHLQGQLGRGGAMGSSPVGTMGQSAMMPPGYSHRPGSAGSVAGMGGAGPMPGGPPPGHPMMGGGVGMGVSGGTQMMMHQSVQMTQQHGMAAMRGGPGMGGQHPQSASLPPHSAPYSGMVGPGAMQTQANGSHGQQYPAGLGQEDFIQFLSSDQSHNFESLSSDIFEEILK